MLQLSQKNLYLSSLFQIETKKFEEKQKSIDVVSIVSIKEIYLFIYHMFVMLTFMIKKNSTRLRIMINCDVTKNFIF